MRCSAARATALEAALDYLGHTRRVARRCSGTVTRYAWVKVRVWNSQTDSKLSTPSEIC